MHNLLKSLQRWRRKSFSWKENLIFSRPIFRTKRPPQAFTNSQRWGKFSAYNYQLTLIFCLQLKRPYECPEKNCGKRFRQAGCLKNHRASQHGTDFTFNCDVSSKVTTSCVIRIFTRLPPCFQLCGKQFPVKERLRLHLRVHRWAPRFDKMSKIYQRFFSLWNL